MKSINIGDEVFNKTTNQWTKVERIRDRIGQEIKYFGKGKVVITEDGFAINYEGITRVRKAKAKFLCVECSHNNHVLEPFITKGYVTIDGVKYISYTRPPSHKVICGDCGKKTNEVFEIAKGNESR